MRRLLLKIYLVALPFMLFAFCEPALAATPTVAKLPPGITVSPAYVNINILAGEHQVPVTFKLTNNEPSAQVITLKTADFSSLNYSGGLLFVGSNATQLQKEYGLAHWLSLPLHSLTLAPQQTASVSVNINNTSDLAPGGHYGALLFSIGSPEQVNQKNKVSVQPVASALMFVTKLNGATYRLGLSKVTSNHTFFKLPSEVKLLFYNNGNTQVTPRGYITLTSSSNKLISKGIINTDSGLILPGNSRYFEVPLQKLETANQIGNYKLSVNFTFDGLDSYRQYQTELFLGTPTLVIILLVVLIIALILIYKLVQWQKTQLPSTIFGLPHITIIRPLTLRSNYKVKTKHPVPIRDITKGVKKPPKTIVVKDSQPSVKKVAIKDESEEGSIKPKEKAKTPSKKMSVKVKIEDD